MKKLNLFLLAFAAVGMVFTSCSPDESAVGPSLQITSGETVEASGGSITIEWRADAGDKNLATFSILEGNTAVTSGGETWNAFDIPTADNETYTGSVTLAITAATTFTLTVTDKDGLTATKTVTVTVATVLADKGSKTLGAGDNTTLGSYYSVLTNTVYKSGDITATNASTIDFVFDATSSVATFKSPKDATKTLVKDSQRTTKYQKATFAFASATSAAIDAVTPTAENITVSLNDVVVFVNNDGVKGCFEVSALTVATDGSVTIGIKVK